MARETLDTTGNENLDTTLAKIQANFVDLYAADSEFTDWSGTSVTATGAVQGGTVTSTGLATVGSAKIDTGTKTATATAGAATLAKFAGVITSEALTTAAAASYTLTITTTGIGVAAADQVYASVANGTNTQGIPLVSTAVCGTNTVTIVVNNQHAADAFNGTLKISYLVVKN